MLAVMIGGAFALAYERGWGAAQALAQGQPQLILEGEILPVPVRLEGDEAYIPLEDFQAYLDPKAYYDPVEKLLVLTTADRWVVLPQGDLEGWINEEPFRLAAPWQDIGGEVSVPLKALAFLYPLRVEIHPETALVTVEKVITPRLMGVTLPPAAWEGGLWLKEKAHPRSRRLLEVAPGTEVRVWGEEKGWYRVQLADGRVGYLPKHLVSLTGLYAGSAPRPPARPASLPPVPFHLTWDLLTVRGADPSRYPPLPGVAVISPTWLHLEKDGLISSLGDPAYVTAAHERGLQVWALFSNGFDPERTHSFLSSTTARREAARQLLAQAQALQLDGINVDFENVYMTDKDLFTQFIRELAPLFRRAGLVLSVDVTFPGGSPNWSLFYDRQALGEAADFIMVMAYDQTPGNASLPGPTAGLPWVERGLEATLQEVPAEKLLLGLPFYTRLWREEEGGWKSSALGLPQQEEKIREKKVSPVWDETYGVPRVEWQEKGRTYRMWLETQETLRQRVELARRMGLAGVASWQMRLGHEEAFGQVKKTLEEWSPGGNGP
ncbi:MAG: glycosyl hydrolase family 18 protein [Bacillota bacterium]|nr:glycosyl hydrolase family 18 protein [Bacillota bacterium]